MNVKPSIGQKAQNMIAANPIVTGLSLIALIAIGLGIKSKIGSSSTTS